VDKTGWIWVGVGVAVGVVGGYLVLRRQRAAPAVPTSGTGVVPTGTGSGLAGGTGTGVSSGTGTGSGQTLSTGSSPTAGVPSGTSGSGVTVQNLGGGRAANNGGTVQLMVQATGLGQPLVATATATGFQNPVYQFWLYPPGGSSAPGTQNGWESSGDYDPGNTFSWPTTTPGVYRLVVYAKEASAPEQAAYEAESGEVAVVLT